MVVVVVMVDGTVIIHALTIVIGVIAKNDDDDSAPTNRNTIVNMFDNNLRVIHVERLDKMKSKQLLSLNAICVCSLYDEIQDTPTFECLVCYVALLP